MTVQELIAELSKLPGDLEVVLQGDTEGNYYAPLAGTDGDNLGYDPDEHTTGYLVLTEDLRLHGYTDEDLCDEGTPCVVLYPEF